MVFFSTVYSISQKSAKMKSLIDNSISAIRIRLTDERVFQFTQKFTIGRHSDSAICIINRVVSRRHAEILPENGQWWIHDLQSANGIFMDGQRIQRAILSGSGQVRLGDGGPPLFFDVELPLDMPQVAPLSSHTPPAETESKKNPSEDLPSLDHYKHRYFDKTSDMSSGTHTMMIRLAYAEVQKKQRISYGVIMGLLVLLLIITGSVAWYKHDQIVEQKKLASEVFYTMRALEIDLIKLQMEAARQNFLEARKQIEAVKDRKNGLELSYGRYVDSLGVYGKGLSKKEKIIMHMAHRFGECEINMPDSFVREVSKFIEKWQSSKRLSLVIRRARQQGYIPRIIEALIDADLPPQFLYLAVQESNLNHRAVGPPTRWGFAKGMWQFSPSTAERYGLRLGPLKNEPEVDALDERHDFTKSTIAAASYLRDIYTTDAQASGLLVMASYNWGERRVIKLLQKMPENPQERNFWQLLTHYPNSLPDETYDYVFSIFSAAVIGENPRLFGFDFDNPLILTNADEKK
jgi:membrane-bound lytic murein transglycosylase D